MTFLRLLTPGVQLKRWMLLLLVGLVFVSLGFTYLFVELYRTTPLPEAAAPLLDLADRSAMTSLTSRAGLEPCSSINYAVARTCTALLALR